MLSLIKDRRTLITWEIVETPVIQTVVHRYRQKKGFALGSHYTLSNSYASRIGRRRILESTFAKKISSIFEITTDMACRRVMLLKEPQLCRAEL